MIVILKQSLFEPFEDTSLPLLGLFEICADERHSLVTKPPWSSARSAGSMVQAWMERLPSRARREVEAVLKRGLQAQAHSSARRIYVDRVDAPVWTAPIPTLDPRTALRLLRRPLRILVENRWSDGAFLRKMLTPAQRKDLDRALAAGWIEIEQGGGIEEIRKRVDEIRGGAVVAPTPSIDAAEHRELPAARDAGGWRAPIEQLEQQGGQS